MFRIDKRHLMFATAMACSLTAMSNSAFAQATYPNQRVNMLIGFAAGGFADTIARLVGARLAERLNQSFIAQNLEGGGGIRATRQTTVSPADGYTILVTTTSIAINESLVPGRGYKADQVEAVAIPVSAPESLSANKDSGIKNVADLVAFAKAGKVYLGTPGIGSGSHIAAEYFFKTLVKAEVKHIPFSGGNPAMLGLVSGDVNVLASTNTGAPLRNMVIGDTIGIAVAGHDRMSQAPKVPTFAESGYPGYEASSWVGFFVPTGTPATVIEKLNQEINAVMQEEDTRKRIDTLGLEIVLRDRAETAAFFKSEIGNWSKMVEAVGITQ